MTWPKVKLSACCISIADGDHQPPPKADSGVPFVTIANIDTFHSLNFENAMHVPREYYDGLDSKRRATAGDVLYSVVGSFGIPVLVKDNTPFVFQRHIAILRPDKDLLDARFLYYTMCSREFYQKADAVALGAAQRTISLSALRNLEISCPPLPVQRRIADILSAYDDLIENNRKQIKLLEEAAQRLYKEWFIDLRFPGHEHTPIINGLPAGWVRKSFSEVFTYERGRSYSSSEIGDSSEILLVNLKNIKAWGGYNQNAEKCFLGAVKQSQFLKHNDIVMAVTDMTPERRLVGHVALIPNLPHPATFSMDLIRIIPKFLPNLFLYATLSFQKYGSKISLLANGTNVLHLKPDSMMKQIMVIPPECLIDKYEEYFSVIRIKIEYWEKQIRDSIESRDRLLPKLMSREFDVSEIGA